MTSLKFNKKKHTYSVDGIELTSVTTFLKNFFEKFDADKVAKRLAFLNKQKGIKGKGVRYYKKLWKETAEAGTAVHKEIEEVLMKEQGQTYVLPSELAQRGINFAEKFKDAVLVPEMQIYDYELGLAGTIDLMITQSKVITLVDWKTNAKIDALGYKGKKAKEPIKHLDDCKLTHYALQLSLYAYILERQGYNIANLVLYHLPKDEPIFVPYYREEIKEMIKYGKENSLI